MRLAGLPNRPAHSGSSGDTGHNGATSKKPPKMTAEERERIRVVNHGKAMVEIERQNTKENKHHNNV